jgi:hypothetical protein
MGICLKSWKSTASGALSFLIATFTTITAFLAPYLISSPGSTQAVLVKWSAGLTLGTALCRVWIGLIQKDPDVVIATTPGNPVPQEVSAHAVPDDPAAKPVVPQP